jgi:molybdopterin-containing oxidoreductase family membrane subunit
MFSPTFVDIGYRNNWFLLCIVLLYSRTFPVIAQAEIKTILKEQEIITRERAANKDLHHE